MKALFIGSSGSGGDGQMGKEKEKLSFDEDWLET